jgi:plasmid stabilization system protein ParE
MASLFGGTRRQTPPWASANLTAAKASPAKSPQRNFANGLRSAASPMPKFIVSPEAREDLDQIHAYISEENLEAADRVLEAALATVASLARMPGMGRPQDLQAFRAFRPSVVSRRWVWELPYFLPSAGRWRREGPRPARCPRPGWAVFRRLIGGPRFGAIIPDGAWHCLNHSTISSRGFENLNIGLQAASQ